MKNNYDPKIVYFCPMQNDVASFCFTAGDNDDEIIKSLINS